MKTRLSLILFLIAYFGSLHLGYCDKNPTNKSNSGNGHLKEMSEGCLPASGSTDLWINNVRARINTGGDMWWDLQTNAKYFIPGNTQKTSMFSAALWIGGLDVNNQLKLAAQRYRGEGVDFFTGPLTTDGTASVDAETCDEYDKHFVINRADVESFLAAYTEDHSLNGYAIPRSISEYPWKHDQAVGYTYLAPFYDNNADGAYEPKDGDYPYYDFDNSLCPKYLPCGSPPIPTAEGNGILVDQVLKGDQTIWWVFNDKGNIHSETKGSAIGMEVRAQAFAFATNDEINNMTFYSYEIINRSTYRLTQTYFSQWVDTDIGYAYDDYVGCDVLRGLGYCYNGDEIDGTGKPQDYGAQPPAVGVDFFQGPYMDPDGLDNPRYDNDGKLICDVGINGVNFGDCIFDNERFGMRRFVFHNNVGSGGIWPKQDPEIAAEYYLMLRGIWKDGEPMRYGGGAHPLDGGSGPVCAFMFPGETDPCNWGTAGVQPAGYSTGAGGAGPYWTEKNEGNPPYDRRFMQSAGPFTLEPGAVNYITVGIPWARATSGGAWQSVQLLRQVDDKCQTLFDNCFKVLDGPDAPDVAIQELDRELILYISNRKGISNNYDSISEDYAEIDPNIVFADTVPGSLRGDSAYRFEGYQIFQVKDATVSITEIHNTDKARLVAQCDKKNGVSRLINFNYDDNLGANIPEEEVNGSDAGIVHSFRILEDQFASGDKRLINHKQYYYIAIAYSYNNYQKYDPANTILGGQTKPYKAGRKAAAGKITISTGIPHKPSPEAGGTIIHSEYGVQPRITRIEGQGNGGFVLDFTQATFDNIVANGHANELEYDYNKGPVNIKVIDPLNVVGANYTLKFNAPNAPLAFNMRNCSWTLINNDNSTIWNSDKTIEVGNEQLLMDLGLSINIEQIHTPGEVNTAGEALSVNNGFLEATIEYADSSKKWLSGIFDIDAIPTWNWIRAGTTQDNQEPKNDDYYTGSSTARVYLDPGEVYEKVLEGTWAPYPLCSIEEYGPAFKVIKMPYGKMNDYLGKIASIDLIITSDQSKWSRSPVFEECETTNHLLAEGQVNKLDLRYGSTGGVQGMGWFPGYAINVETGERLNIAFGEDSWLQGENGRDMIWNPTSSYTTSLGEPVFGGKHWVYIFGHYSDSVNSVLGDISCPAYDQGQFIKQIMQIPSSNANQDRYRQLLFRDCMWVGGPMLADPSYSFHDPANIPCDVKIRIRVAKPYERYYSSKGTGPQSPVNDNYPMYNFNTINIATETGSQEAAEGALDLINVVPNPYYAYSAYEINQLDNRVRITNLPDKCTVTIYTINGTLIRQYSKDDAITSLDWDLKNFAGIPISGGIYLIHVKVDGVGEKVIKWFGALRPIDLNSF